MPKLREGCVMASLMLPHKDTDIPGSEAEYAVYPVADGHDDVWAINPKDDQPYLLSDEQGRALLKRIETEQPDTWREIRAQGVENSRSAA